MHIRVLLSIVAAYSIIICMFIVLLFDDSKPASACSCQSPISALESLEQYDAVFSGKVIGLETVDSDRVATFDVDTVWKGITKEPVQVTTGTGRADCGYSFEENKSYLVYAGVSSNDILSTSYCTRTTSLDRAESDLVALGQGDFSFSSTKAVYEQKFRLEHPALIVAIAGFACAVIGVLAISRRKKPSLS